MFRECARMAECTPIAAELCKERLRISDAAKCCQGPGRNGSPLRAAIDCGLVQRSQACYLDRRAENRTVSGNVRYSVLQRFHSCRLIASGDKDAIRSLYFSH